MQPCPMMCNRERKAQAGRWASLGLLCALLVSSRDAYAKRAQRPEGHRVDRIVAVVEDDIITAFELEERAAGHIEALPSGEDKQQQRRARRQVLERVLDEEIGERLLTRELKTNKDRLGVTDKDVDRAVDEVLATNRIDQAQLQAALFGQHMTMAEYREKMRQQIERARLMQFKVQGKVHVKENDARRLCLERERMGEADMQVCAGHILLSVAPQATAAQRRAARDKAAQLRARLLRGESLAKLAQAYSDDTASPDGSLGCFFRGEMVEAFEKAAFALKDGEVSDVVETSFGMHVIKAFEHRARDAKGCASDADLQPFHAELMQQEMARQMQLWLEELRRRSYVDVRL